MSSTTFPTRRDSLDSLDLLLNIVGFTGEPLPAGSPAIVEIRDTSLADAPAKVLYQQRVVVPPTTTVMTVPVKAQLAALPDGTTVRVHIDVDHDGRVSRGDFVTVESYPVTSAPTQSLTVRVKKVQ
jgi:uncharacterized lipoprotein YbaY